MSWVSNWVDHMEREGETMQSRGSSSESDFNTDQPAFFRPPLPSGSTSLSCDICHKAFDKLALLVTHIVVYHGRDEDDYDNGEKREPLKVSRRARRTGRARANKLYMVHKFFSTNKPFKCEICQRSYAFEADLITHMDTHIEKTKYSCQRCKREFLEEDHLTQHLNTKAYDPSACDTCGKKFPSWSLLSEHRLEHLRLETPIIRDT